MKIRIKFAKEQEMRFIGHLDLMRFFQKAMRLAGIDIRFTEGMSPHMVMSFASPLGVGYTSEGEYLDIDINTPVSTQQALQRLNAVMPCGLKILDFRQVKEGKSSNAMALVAAADYELHFREGHMPGEEWREGITAFFALPVIEALKETKKSSRLTDIRPMIHHLQLHGESVLMTLACGSSENLKPDFLMRTYLDRIGIKADPFAFEIRRMELYAHAVDNSGSRFVSLNDLGHVIPDDITERSGEAGSDDIAEGAGQVILNE